VDSGAKFLVWCFVAALVLLLDTVLQLGGAGIVAAVVLAFLGAWAADEYRRWRRDRELLAALPVADVPDRSAPAWMVAEVLRAWGGSCAYCGSTKDLQIDHIHPWAMGGATALANLQPLCRSCNLLKGTLSDSAARQRYAIRTGKLPRTPPAEATNTGPPRRQPVAPPRSGYCACGSKLVGAQGRYGWYETCARGRACPVKIMERIERKDLQETRSALTRRRYRAARRDERMRRLRRVVRRRTL